MNRTILFVVNHAGFFVSHRLPIALAAQEAGYDVHIATPKSKHVPRILGAGLPWHRIRLSRSGKNPLRELLTAVDLYRLYRSLRPALVHHVSSKPVLYGTTAARLTRVPAVVNAISGLGHVFADEAAVKRLLRSGVSLLYRLSLRHPRMRVIFQNREQQTQFLDRGWVKPAECVLIPGSGVDTDAFHPHPAEERTPTVLFASRMLFTKGVLEFVTAARALRHRGVNARFVLVGEPDPDNIGSVPESTLRQWAAEGIVEYRGRSEKMPDVFAEADIFCLPTYYGEGVPKVLVEAAASGIPSITTDWPGCRDVVEDGVTGILVPIKDPERLAAAMERLLADPETRRRMGGQARQRAVANYSLRMVIDRTLALYRELLE